MAGNIDQQRVIRPLPKAKELVMPPITNQPQRNVSDNGGWNVGEISARRIDVTPSTTVDLSKPIRIVMIDDFADKDILVDGDVKPDISHGRLGELIIADHQTNLDIRTEHVSGTDLQQLQHYAVNLPKDTAAVTLASGTGMSIERMRELTGIRELDLHNVSQHQTQIITTINKINKKSGEFNDLIKAWTLIDQIADSGVPVYVAIGNYKQVDNTTICNLYSLARGATVLSPDDSGGTFGTRLIPGPNGGYDFTENGTVDLKFPEATRGELDDSWGMYTADRSSSRATFWAAVLRIRELASKG